MALLLALACAGASAHAEGVTNSGDDLRDGWYPNQPRLAPDAVSAGSFGQLWKADVDGQVYAQPLVVGSTVYVVTERNQVYALDSETGDLKWTRDLGAPFPATLIGSAGCPDLTPDLGITSTPVIDRATNTIYLTHKTFAPGSTTAAASYMDALDASTGEPRAGFPRRFEGVAQNTPAKIFMATTELQRPGLLLMGGVVYAAFGGHCDIHPYQGWVFGVDAASGAVKARWSAVLTGDGAGIWQSGAGLMSDGPGRLFVSTGNGNSPPVGLTAPGNGAYGESIVRLDVQPDGKLKPGDFFAPSDAAYLDGYDADFASGGVTGLRDDAFGTSTFPHVSVAVGKAGYVYLLNRDDLGGIGTGVGQGDRVIERVGPYGGVWSRPSVWPGDGGWIAIPTASPAAGAAPFAAGSVGRLNLYRYRVNGGVPSLDAPISSDDAFGFGSSAPVITSDGTASGSAVMWVVWSPNGTGAGAQLRAYDAVPVSGHLKLRRSWPIGQSAKFGMPGIGDGRVYVGTRDGHVLGYGAPVTSEVQAPATTFPTTTVDATSTVNVKLTITGAVHLTSVSAGSGGPFTARPDGHGVPGDYTDGQSATIPVDFKPTAPGVAGGALTVVTDKGTFTFSLTGTGQGTAPLLTVSPPVVSFGGVVVGQDLAGTVTLGNAGEQPLTIQDVTLPGAPFSVDAAPHVGDVIAPGGAVNVAVHYRPDAVGEYNQDLVLETTGGDATVGLSGTAGLGPRLTLSPAGGWSFGDVAVGSSADATVTVANTGDSAMTITRSKPPTAAAFTVVDGLDEATTIQPGASRAVEVRFTPTTTGPVAGLWTLNAADGSGVHDIPLTGVGVAPGHVQAARTATFPDAVLGATSGADVTFANDGGAAWSVVGVDAPAAPFAVTAAPAAGTEVAPGASVTVHATFSPLVAGEATGRLALRTTAGVQAVALTARGVSAAEVPIVPPAPIVAPPAPGPGPIGGQGPVLPTLLPSKLSVSRLVASRDRRRVTVRGRVTAAAAGRLSIAVAARVGRRTVTVSTPARLRGRSTYALSITLPRAARSWSRLKATVRFPGSARVRAGSASLVLLRAR
ncbi:choice-of-anchor D domain-containing protein [Baekduia alba]|uniref:choice-of-anchor D domain-containing protein n=1 Tax=Baekduia alba TaxID=2997333 RepID=UPI00233FDA20|nr:choice-of-anchor D domain-containing protein [Baekduia alba]